MEDNNGLYFKRLSENAIIPMKATKSSAGFDLFAAKTVDVIGGMGNIAVPTDISVRIPKGHYGRIAMRSGLALRNHLTVSAGVIDIDYTGQIIVLVSNTKTIGDENENIRPICTINKGDRFAQLIIEKIYDGPAVQVDNIIYEGNAHVGFGSTGSGALVPPEQYRELPY